MTFKTMQRKANQAGYSLQRGRQRYHHDGWGFVKDCDGIPVIGYQIFDYRLNGIIYGVNDLHDHALDLDEAVADIKRLCEAEGVAF